VRGGGQSFTNIGAQKNPMGTNMRSLTCKGQISMKILHLLFNNRLPPPTPVAKQVAFS